MRQASEASRPFPASIRIRNPSYSRDDLAAAPAGSPARRFRFSLTRVGAVIFSVFSLWVMHGLYVSYWVVPKVYWATAQIQVAAPRDSASPDPLRAEVAFMQTPDVLSPIITDLQLDRIWARRVYKSGLDALPMQDALSYLNRILHITQEPGTDILDIRAASEVPKEASDVANAVADRYKTVRDMALDERNHESDAKLNDQIAQQQQVVAQKASAIETIRSQLQTQGISVGPGTAGIIATDLALQKNGNSAQSDAFAPLRAAQAQLDAQQRALDDLQLRLRQAKADEQLNESPVSIIARAEPPEYPTKPNQADELTFNIITGSVLAIILAALCELFLWYVSRIAPVRPYIPQSQAAPTPASAEY